MEETMDLEIASVPTNLLTRNTELKLRTFYLEPVLIFNNFAITMTGSILTQFLQYQACHAVFDYDETECKPLLGASVSTNASDQIQKVVQPYVSNIKMADMIIGSIISAVTSLFIGAWSDEFGRRPVLLIGMTATLIGYIFSTILLIISSLVKFNPWIYVVTSLPFVFVGGTCTIMAMVYCVVTEEVPPLEKAIRFFGNEASISFGVMLGTVTGKPLFAATNIIVVYAIATCLMLLSLFFVIFFFKESMNSDQIRTKFCWHAFFHVKFVKELMSTTFAVREDCKRIVILMAIGALFILSFISNGEREVVNQFYLKQFDVTSTQNTIFNAVNRLNHQLSGMIALKLFVKVFELSLPVITLTSLCSATIECLIFGFANYWWQVYLASGVGFFATVAAALFLTIISKTALITEGGKLFALISALQTLAPLGASIVYTTILHASLGFYPGLFFLLSLVLFLVCVILATFIFVIQGRTGTLLY